MNRTSRRRDTKAALTFVPISLFSPGTLADLIRRSYAELVEQWPEYWKEEGAKWDDFDRQAFAHPETIGKCVFVSLLDGQPIGLASYDPRQAPRYGMVGQNCVLPEFRGRGLGRRQILEVLRRFGEQRIESARVTTSEHPFFLPAIKMYQGLGFREIRRFAGGPDPEYRIIELQMPLGSKRASA